MDSSDLATLRSTYLYQPGHKKHLSQSAKYWNAPIRNLLQAGYSFLPIQYSDNGYLFRGIRTGLTDSIKNRHFDHVPGNEEINQVERAMGVYFISHEISDAITVSALHDSQMDDNAILAIKSDYFNRQLQSYRAAVMAIGDAGIVFRYPVLSEPLGINDIEYIIMQDGKKSLPVPEIMQQSDNKHVVVSGRNRQELMQNLLMKFNELDITAAKPVTSDLYPV